MNESNRHKIPRALRAAIAAPTIALISSAALLGCLRSDPRTFPPSTPANFSALVKDIAQFRGLSIKREIVLAGFAPDTGPAASNLPFSSELVEPAYRNIGLIPRDSDLGKALVEVRRFVPKIIDDAAKTSVVVAEIANKLGAPFEKTHPTLARELSLALAVVEGLQEQNFQWQSKINSTVLEDRRLALRAIAVGDAVLTAIARANGKAKGNLTAAELEMAGRVAVEIEKLAVNLPDFLRDETSLPYRGGTEFVLWALRASGWPGVNALYARPPLSTAQIIHPEKYFIQPELPQRFFPAALLRRLGGSAPVEQSLGECLIRSLLAGVLPSKAAENTAAGWRGDQLFSFPINDDLLTAWYSSWRSAQDAANFHRAYRVVLERQHQVRFDSSAAITAGALAGTRRDGRGVWLQVNGSVVLLLTGAPAPYVNELAEEAWKDLEIDADTGAIPLDLAARKVTGR